MLLSGFKDVNLKFISESNSFKYLEIGTSFLEKFSNYNNPNVILKLDVPSNDDVNLTCDNIVVKYAIIDYRVNILGDIQIKYTLNIDKEIKILNQEE